ncbi:hypothetical protein GCM10025865_30100 [Paraoerskovia sediminicola]|uniref:Amino acid permease n=1 Tax=Paraoerskovia sediminicola TaxID=1138587 RepID=A0ABM8G6H3_9CELL|nr:APC family permease [Paraoerskovia sediminicola]BDZ43711.1 hypothetical protein GCM10025865_30100 [Paraoerskovia sediminicola]
MFFAFAGYARIATLGEEVRDPRSTIPRAVVLSLGIVLAVYLVLAVIALRTLGVDGLAESTAPLSDVVRAAGHGGWVAVVALGASAACLGALLGLIAGVGRTALAMARHGDLPSALAVVHPQRSVPQRAEITLGIVLVVLVIMTDLRAAVGVSSFCVLVYYAIANASALRQSGEFRRYPRFVAWTGLVGCVVLAITLPISAVIVGGALLAAALAGRWAILHGTDAPEERDEIRGSDHREP